MKRTIQEILAEAEIMAESPRSVRIFNELTAKLGRPLSCYDIGKYTDALESSINPDEVLQDMALDVQSVVSSNKELFRVDVRPDMSVAQIAQMLWFFVLFQAFPLRKRFF